MNYEESVATAPAGWRHFTHADIARLPAGVRERELARIPPGESGDRILRALFWTLVYHLEPDKWDELARSEPIHPDILAALPRHATTALDVGAGSGRLTEHLVARSNEVTAVEPSARLRAILEKRLPSVRAIDGWAESLPIADGWSQLTAACGALGPEPQVLSELRRVTAHGGWIALISPEQPEWFEANGWKRVTARATAAPPHAAWLDEFFGPLDPPRELVVLRAG
ncbi:MAG TPA: methyltransferase domain-containing protein [Candidatus Dormibacteraeota bacterium]|nr:methyltransferase domain-containing protein [Candidatus Dormibacteraeota bacterium]